MSNPAIILVRPQLGENIGKAARSMLNFGLEDLRLVAPRDGWPNADAVAPAADADRVLENARVFETTGEAIADLTRVYAATVRTRDMPKPVQSLRQAADEIRGMKGGRAGILFGRESSGLSNDDVVLADAILTIPVNPDFSSLNLAVAVGIISCECYGGPEDISKGIEEEGDGPATKADMAGLFEHLEGALDEKGYFYPPERKEPLVRSLRNLLTSANLNRQQVNTLRGVIKALTRDFKNQGTPPDKDN